MGQYKNCPLFGAQEFNRLRCLTSYAVYLSEFELHRKQDVVSLSEEALSILGEKPDPTGIDWRWFELVGDWEPDHRKAVLHYAMSIESATGWAPTWIKGLGAAHLADLLEEVRAIRNRLTADNAATLLWSMTLKRRRRPTEKPFKQVVVRWNQGLQLFDEFWGSNGRVHSAVQQLSQENQSMGAVGT